MSIYLSCPLSTISNCLFAAQTGWRLCQSPTTDQLAMKWLRQLKGPATDQIVPSTSQSETQNAAESIWNSSSASPLTRAPVASIDCCSFSYSPTHTQTTHATVLTIYRTPVATYVAAPIAIPLATYTVCPLWLPLAKKAKGRWWMAAEPRMKALGNREQWNK